MGRESNKKMEREWEREHRNIKYDHRYIKGGLEYYKEP